MTALYEIDGVSHRYSRRSRPALDDVSLSLTKGSGLGIVGESGSGKTTLAMSMLGFVRPSAGEIRFDGRSVASMNRRAQRDFRRRVQLVLQDPYASLNPRMRVEDLISEPLRIATGKRDHAARVHELLAAVELPAELSVRRPHELSGGQRQRVAIARALAPRPEVVIADEPVSALDVSVRRSVLALLRRLAEHEGVTFVVISHDLGIIDRLCAEAAVMHEGRLVEHGPTSRLLSAPEHPYTSELISSIPALPPRRTAGIR
ncbi:ABC transporter ATP-binding protein [Microbacterium halotolerans]|uniref:ABC transporter ATP-binding protein n=1 Tax=Microbacterium halotolerans TaxID=246613 RepID=UPI000E6A9728|nr:ABC transporter ATP-binding protein [Microbacterium halotolerans]